jgi:hypothetical protein
MPQKAVYPEIRDDGLQLDEDRQLQERIWTAERVAHVVFGLIVLAGLLGLAGSGGPLARATQAGEAGSVEYLRIARFDTAANVTIRFAAPRADHRVRIAGPFPDRAEIESVQPQPVREVAGPDGITFEFAAEAGEPASVTLRLRPTTPGVARLTIAIDDAAPFAGTMVVLP